MPTGFDRCVKNGGKVTRDMLKQDQVVSYTRQRNQLRNMPNDDRIKEATKR